MATSSASVAKTRRKRKQIVDRFKNERGCQECGERHPAVLDLHHRDGEEKHEMLRLTPGKRRGTRSWRDLSFAAIEAELQKCDVLCSNCHRILTASRRAAAPNQTKE